MATENNKRDQLLKELSILYLDFNSSLDDLESEKWTEFSEKSKKIILKLNAIKSDLCHDYPSSLENRFEDLQKNFPQLPGQGNEYSERKVIHRLEKIEKQILGLKSEVKTLYPNPPFLTKFKSWLLKKEFIFAVAILGMGGIFFILNLLRPVKNGLRGDYFSMPQFTQLYKTRIDPSINFDWNLNAPLSGMKPDLFSIRWTGYLAAPKEGEYEFSTQSDDGVNLWIDDAPIIQNWTIHSLTVNTATTTLTQGTHKIKLEYFENKKKAIIKLFWKIPGDIHPKIIPEKFLIPDEKYLEAKDKS